MTNRFFTRPVADLASRCFDQPLNFSEERFLAFSSDLDKALLGLEQKQANKTRALGDPKTTVEFFADVCREPRVEQLAFDASGLDPDLEIDVRWI